MDAIDVLGLVSWLIQLIFIVPLIVYGMIIFREYVDDDIIKFRNSRLIYSINLMTLATLLIERPLSLSGNVWNIIDLGFGIWLVWSLFWWWLFLLFAIKVYHLYYQQKYNIAMHERSWRKDLNPSAEDWFIKNRSTWGNVLWLMKVSLIPYVLINAIGLILPMLVNSALVIGFWNFFLSGSPTWLACVFSYKSRKVNDIYNIRNEIWLSSSFILVGVLSYTIVFVLFHLDTGLQQGQDMDRLKWVIYEFLLTAPAIGFSVVGTLYPVQQVKRADIERRLNLLRTRTTSNTPTGQASRRKSLNLYSLHSMNDAFSEYHSFKSFVSFAVSAFCVESVLFLVEVVQCKHEYQREQHLRVRFPFSTELDGETFFGTRKVRFVQLNEDEAATNTQTTGAAVSPVTASDVDRQTSTDQAGGSAGRSENDCADAAEVTVTIPADKYSTCFFNENGAGIATLAFAKDVPRTGIVSQYEDDLRCQMHALYKKYVMTDSTHEINVSYLARRKVEVLCGELSGVEIPANHFFTAMDECALEVMRLLHTPFGTWKQDFNTQCQHEKSPTVEL